MEGGVMTAGSERRAGTDRRGRRVSLRYPERRSGFDRRAPEGGAVRLGYERLLGGLRRRPRAVAAVLAAILVANVADLGATFVAVRMGAEELNPVMARLMGVDPLLASAFKLLVAVGVASSMWALRRYRKVLELSLLVLLLMAGLTAYHGLGLAVAM
jgi:hypothetical protein